MATRLGSLIGRRLRQRRRDFARDERGATLIEFAILALPFFSIVGAILETSVVFLSGQVLESATQDVSRLIRTGQAQGMMSAPEDFKSRICARVYGLFPNCETDLHVEVQTITDFDSATISPPIDWSCEENCDAQWTRDEQYSSGGGGSIMMVQVYYKWPIMISLGDMTLGNLPGNKRLMSASTVFRNEPFT
ncbi:TadE/TadG family type IV pilus assembly protein [Devosia sp. SL43]|uniref:TadE/TadG family type IV pilus assembly protein n=1 Tax=Devosia sp. SL43 TaxID=2806348 RepID=UPI001F451EBB|nr:TadE/TadG family type IV pilus assembly protein [Devosia sp. SL43]UJW84847.1 pilus assembly protein [Devosia sp. SL43]